MRNFKLEDIEKTIETKKAIQLKKELGRYTDKNAAPKKNSGASPAEKKDSLKIPKLSWM
jgi:hypothetical protein